MDDPFFERLTRIERQLAEMMALHQAWRERLAPMFAIARGAANLTTSVDVDELRSASRSTDLIDGGEDADHVRIELLRYHALAASQGREIDRLAAIVRDRHSG